MGGAAARSIAARRDSIEFAHWMIAELDAREELLQQHAAKAIKKKFGKDFVYLDEGGNLAIDRRVLYQFGKLTGDTVVWVTKLGGGFWSGVHWKKRGPGDAPGRTQSIW
jgi:hypothetical protein